MATGVVEDRATLEAELQPNLAGLITAQNALNLLASLWLRGELAEQGAALFATLDWSGVTYAGTVDYYYTSDYYAPICVTLDGLTLREGTHYTVELDGGSGLSYVHLATTVPLHTGDNLTSIYITTGA